jgi:hypothetical protein
MKIAFAEAFAARIAEPMRARLPLNLIDSAS